MLKKYIQRGKVDMFISYEDYTESKVSLKYNASLAAEYMEYFRQMADQFQIPCDVTVTSLGRCPEIFTMEQVPEDEEHMWKLLEEAISEAAEKFVDRAKLEDKVKELLENSSIDEGRIAAEVTIFADKICTDEETVRLRSHIEATRAELTAGGSVGRKLDFIAQEMNREANTILSKANDLEVSDKAIALKTEIEKVREQIQNIE